MIPSLSALLFIVLFKIICKMLIYINDNPQELQEQTPHLTDLLKVIQQENSKGIAIAINGRVISKRGWTVFRLNENDRVTLIRATQGG
jgi:sulfur carrier protein